MSVFTDLLTEVQALAVSLEREQPTMHWDFFPTAPDAERWTCWMRMANEVVMVHAATGEQGILKLRDLLASKAKRRYAKQ